MVLFSYTTGWLLRLLFFEELPLFMLTLLSYVKRRHWAMIAHNTSPDFAGLAFGWEEFSGVSDFQSDSCAPVSVLVSYRVFSRLSRPIVV